MGAWAAVEQGLGVLGFRLARGKQDECCERTGAAYGEDHTVKGEVCEPVLRLPASGGSLLLLSGPACKLCAGGRAAAALGSSGVGRAGEVGGHLD